MKKKTFILGIMAFCASFTMNAQYTIYPIPHEQTAGTGTVGFTSEVTVVCESGIDSYTKARAEQVFKEHGITVTFADEASTTNANVYLGVNGSNGTACNMLKQLSIDTSVFDKEGKYDRHIVSLTDEGNGRAQLVIVGENTDATFYGLASLEQIFDNGTTALQPVLINDYADLKDRGIIEGFYGKPYANDVRKDLLRFMMRYKMNTYVYGPKSDYYHSGDWRGQYPTTLTAEQESAGFMTQDKMRDLASVAHDTKVNLVWAIHPGNALLNDADAVSEIMTKFGYMYDLGFRQFAVFCDDVSIPSDEAGMTKTADRIGAIQKAIEAKWNVAGALPNDTVKPLRFTPQIYCRGFAGSDTQFNSFFKALRALPANVTVYYTGGGVWSVPNNNDLNVVQNQFGRNVIWWWNYPCNDNGTGPNEIYPLDMKSNFVDMPNVANNSTIASELTASNMGIISNPMEQGCASKTAVFSVGDYCWNNKAFNNNQSWEASFKAILPNNQTAQEAYRFLAPYLSKNDPSSLNALINSYKTSKDATALNALMNQIIEKCDVMTMLGESTLDNERLLYTDIKPWVLHLRETAVLAKAFIADGTITDAVEAWTSYRSNVKKTEALTTNTDFMAQHMSGFGQSGITLSPRLSHVSNNYLTPFVSDYLYAHAVDNQFVSSSMATTAELFTNVELKNAPRLTYSGTEAYITMTRANVIGKDGYVGYELPIGRKVSSIVVADSLLNNDKFDVLVSANGKQWTKLTSSDSLPIPYLRYAVVYNNTDEAQPLALRMSSLRFKFASRTSEAVRSTEVTRPTGADEFAYWQNHTADLMADGDYGTYTCINKDAVNGDTYTVRLQTQTVIKNVRIVMGTTNGDNAPKGSKVQISTDGSTWYNLREAGTTGTDYDVNSDMAQQVGTESGYGSAIMASDFIPADADGKYTERKASYVRLLVQNVSGKKWLRLHEIEVNPTETSAPAFVDANGTTLFQPTDGSGATSTKSCANLGEFIYNLSNSTLIDGVNLFCDETTMDNAMFSYTTDEETWKELPYDGQRSVVSLSFTGEQRTATAIKVSWTEKTVPAIYEVAEVASENAERPVVSGIETVTADQTEPNVISIVNGQLVAKSATGINHVQVYTIDGRNVLTQHLQGATQVIVPLTAAHHTVLVKVILANGKSETVKALLK